MAVNDFSNQNIQDTYQRVVQTDGTNLADGTGSLLPISFEGNDVIVPGALKAQSYIVSESVVSVSSGSTIFGNSLDDVHQITGSLSITGSELRIKRTLASNNEAIIVENHVGPLITIGGTSMVNAPKIVGSQGALYIQNSDGVHISKDAVGTVGFGNALYVRGSIRTTTDLRVDGGVDIVSTAAFGNRITAQGYIETPSYVSASRIITTNVTASGNISASGNLTAANTFTTNLTLYPSSDSVFKIFSTDLTTTTHEFHGRGNINSFLAIPTTHKLGIGLNNDEAPQAKLHVSGNISASGTIIGSNITGTNTGDQNIANLAVTGSNVIFNHITASGNISSSGDLIANNITVNEEFIIVTGSSTSHGFQLSRDGLDTYKIRHLDGGLTIQNSSDSRKEMTFDGTGNVGIGTTDPQKKLDIAGGDIRLDNSKGIFFATTDANVGRVSITGDESSDFIQLKVDNSNNHLLRLNTTGVGIGTSSPSQKLTVEGSISASGFIKVGGSGQFGNLMMNTNSLTTSQNDTTSLTLQSETISIKVNDDDFIDLEFDEQLIKMFKKTRFSSDINVLSNITASGNISASGHLNIAGITSSGDVHVDQYIYHDGDLTNYHRFLSNRQIFVVGNDSSIDLNNGVSIFGVASKATTVQGNELNLTGPITASGNISASGTIVADDGSGKQFTVRPNLFFFATNTGTNIENEIGTGAGDQEGSLPNTNTTTVGLTEEQNSHAGVFDLTNNRLTISRAGLYRFSYNCSIEIANGSGRCESYCGLVQETSGGTITTVDGTEGRGYHRFVEDASTAASGQSMGATVVVNVAAGSKYDMRFGTENQDVANSNLQTIPQGTSFYVEALT